MSLTLSKLEKLKESLDALKERELQRTAKYNMWLEQLKENFGCSSKDEGDELLEQSISESKKKREELESEFNKLLEDLKEYELL